jgi:uncharacterized protein (DUF433 family)
MEIEAKMILEYKPTKFPRIVKADIFAEDEPVIAGTRIPVYTIVTALMNGNGINQLQERYPEVSRQAILDAFHYYLHYQDCFDQRLEEDIKAFDASELPFQSTPCQTLQEPPNIGS